jgi:hypothetical protein
MESGLVKIEGGTIESAEDFDHDTCMCRKNIYLSLLDL